MLADMLKSSTETKRSGGGVARTAARELGWLGVGCYVTTSLRLRLHQSLSHLARDDERDPLGHRRGRGLPVGRRAAEVAARHVHLPAARIRGRADSEQRAEPA